MTERFVTRESDGATVDIKMEEAENADLTANAKRVVFVDAAGNTFLDMATSFTQAMENNANGQTTYIGLAVPGSAKSAASWQIRKITYSGVFATDIQFAGGSTAFTNIWDNRAALSYS